MNKAEILKVASDMVHSESLAIRHSHYKYLIELVMEEKDK